MQTASVHENEEIGQLAINAGEHIIGEFIGDESRRSLVVFGGIHGNEQSGVVAMRRMQSRLKELESRLKGRVYLVAGNTRALQKNVRFIDADLNRHWTDEAVKRNIGGTGSLADCVEDMEQREILEILDRVFSTAQNEVYVMDLHSTSAESEPFAMIGDTLRNREFARKFPAIILLGIEEQLDSTILEYINNLGAVTLGFEAGQHTTKTAVDNQEALIWLALLNSGIVREQDVSRIQYENVLKRATEESRLIEIRHRHGIAPTDEFEMKPGYKNFQPIRKGEVLASDKTGGIKAVEGGMILMPLYQKQGNDGFFLGREISRFWLFVSKYLRKLKLGNFVRFLPGVNKHPKDEDALIVNTHVARLFPLQIFHLLGFRKRRWLDEKLVVSRRKHDTVSPFKKNVSA